MPDKKKSFNTDSLYSLAFQNQIPLSGSIELLTQCNWNCTHCYLPEHKQEGLNKETIVRLYTELRELGTLDLTLTGGEIFLRKDIMEIITIARMLGFRVYLFSNASLLNADIIQRLHDLYIFQFSCTIFSVDDEIHDSITRQKGSLKRTFENVGLLREAGINVEVKTPVMTANRDTFVQTRNYFLNRGFAYQASSNICLKKDGDTSPQNLRISIDETRDFLPYFEDAASLNLRPKTADTLVCPILRYTFAISANGDVYPCASYFKKMGNINEQSFSEIWNAPSSAPQLNEHVI